MLKVERHPIPTPGLNEILIRVHASSVSWWDTVYRTGLIKTIPGREYSPMPQQLGREAVGDVIVVGPLCDNSKLETR